MRIYWKIFIGFWIATFLMLSLALLVSHLASGQREDRLHQPPHRMMRGVVRTLQQDGTEALSVWLGEQPISNLRSVYVFNATGDLLFPDAAPARVESLASSTRLRGRKRLIRRVEGDYYLRRAPGPQGQSLLVVLHMSPPWLRQFREKPLLRYGTALLVSGFVCYLLTLVLTRRINSLGDTVRRLADGQLDARVDWVRADRAGDEIQGLALACNRMAERLQQLLDGQEQLIKGVSHELRSPLARMHLLVELARQRSGSAPELGRLELELERLEGIVNDLLLLPRLEQSSEFLDEVMDLGSLLDSVVTDCQVEAVDIAVPIEWSAPQEDCLVRGRATLLRSVFGNILNNALRHAPGGSAVTVSLKSGAHSHVVEVRDWGPGVREEELERIFEPFYRASSARERATGGVGLGLSIARRVVLAHGGNLTAQRAEPGLSMRVELPGV